jgi:Na+/H+-translocating membrane pyrophosphatase
VLLIIGIYFAAINSYPANFILLDVNHSRVLTPLRPYICSLLGLVSGMLIGGVTEYYTSHNYHPVRELANSSRSGAGTNIIYGLALGYLSTIIPVCLIAFTAYMSLTIMGYYGVALAALGMLANLPVSLALDGYGPISDNAGGIAEMAGMGP